MGDVAAHNPFVDVDMRTITHQMPYIITALEELSSICNVQNNSGGGLQVRQRGEMPEGLWEVLLTMWEPFRGRLIFCEVPGVTPRAMIGTKIFWRIGGGDLVSGRGQCLAFGGVLAFAVYRAF